MVREDGRTFEKDTHEQTASGSTYVETATFRAYDDIEDAIVRMPSSWLTILIAEEYIHLSVNLEPHTNNLREDWLKPDMQLTLTMRLSLKRRGRLNDTRSMKSTMIC